ncbi:uncharacterized protein LOC126915393 [Bombus affinis]|uniref:uncharacterized protein LOC126915393 n=1 Tax=Bombus affinis TaxID=309941 RepID=UPI0021B7006D|nr:uncharacterized protein LOC126915393 [Bombus affinis]
MKKLTSARFVTLVTTLRGETLKKRGLLRDVYAGLIARPGRGFLSRWWWSRKLGVTNSRRRTSLLKRGEAERRGSAKKGKSYKRGTGHDDGHQTPQHEGVRDYDPLGARSHHLCRLHKQRLVRRWWRMEWRWWRRWMEGRMERRRWLVVKDNRGPRIIRRKFCSPITTSAHLGCNHTDCRFTKK